MQNKHAVKYNSQFITNTYNIYRWRI